MKKIIYPLCLCFLISAISSCSKQLDNYDAPSETVTGTVTDAITNMPMQTEVGSGGIRVRLDELSWSDNPTPFYFYAEQNGVFNNTKIFKGNYRISVEGPFVPLLQQDNTGAIIADKRMTKEIQGTTEADFTVEPLLTVKWVGEPVSNPDGTISVSIVVNRGTANPDFQNDVTDISLFINALPYVGNNNYDNRYSNLTSYSGTAGSSLMGQTITITTKGDSLPSKRDYYLRVGARTNYGLKQYNYTDVKKVTLP